MYPLVLIESCKWQSAISALRSPTVCWIYTAIDFSVVCCIRIIIGLSLVGYVHTTIILSAVRCIFISTGLTLVCCVHITISLSSIRRVFAALRFSPVCCVLTALRFSLVRCEVSAHGLLVASFLFILANAEPYGESSGSRWVSPFTCEGLCSSRRVGRLLFGFVCCGVCGHRFCAVGIISTSTHSTTVSIVPTFRST